MKLKSTSNATTASGATRAATCLQSARARLAASTINAITGTAVATDVDNTPAQLTYSLDTTVNANGGAADTVTFFDVVTGKDRKHRHWLTPVGKKGGK